MELQENLLDESIKIATIKELAVKLLNQLEISNRKHFQYILRLFTKNTFLEGRRLIFFFSFIY